MIKTNFLCALAICAIVFSACQQNIEDIRGGKPSDQTASTTSTTSAGMYDPLKDPLVNQKDMFEPAPADAGQIASDDTLIIRLEGSPTNLNPIFFSAAMDQIATDPLFMMFVTADARLNWVINKDMAESVDEAPDHLSCTVKMKPGLTWHDGKPLTARDVRFSWQAIMDDKVPCPAFKTGPDQIADVQAIDDLTVKYVFKEALATNKWNMQFPIIPQHIYDIPAERNAHPNLLDGDYYNKYNREGVIGCGPYKLVSWVANDRLVYERWENFTGKKPHFKRIIMKIQPDQQTSLLLFKQGQVDYIETLFSQQFAKETNDAAFAAHGRKAYCPQWTFRYIGWNMDGSNPFFSDVRVRRAMSHALDVTRIIREVTYGLPTPAHGIFHPDSGFAATSVKPIAYDLAAAGKLLDEAGWKLSPGDGWRYKFINSVQVKFDFELIIPQGAGESVEIAAIYTNALRQIGVSMRTRIIEWTVFQKMTHNHEAQSWIAAWGYGADPDGSYNVWHSSQYEGGRNYGGYKNKRVDELFEAGRREFEPQKRAAIYQEIDRLIHEDQPYTFVFYRPNLSAIHKRLRGVQLSPVGLTLFYPGWTAWWVPKNQSVRQ